MSNLEIVFTLCIPILIIILGIRNFTSMHYIVFFYWYHHLSLQELLALAWEA